jgi:hypothetical protein
MAERWPKPGIQQHSATPKGSSKPAATTSIPQATAATAAAGKPPRYPEPDATAPGGGEKTPPTRAQGCGTAALAQPLSRVTRSHCRRRGLQGAQLRSSPKGPAQMGTTHRCSGWTEDLQRHRGWAPEVA